MSDTQASEPLSLAEVSIGLVLIPHESFRREVAAASAAVTAKMHNDNVIDESHFPAHLSLYLGGAIKKGIEGLVAGIEAMSLKAPATLDVAKLARGSRGFLFAQVVKTPRLSAFARKIIEQGGVMHHRTPVYRPHLVRKWGTLSPERRALLREFGTYKTADTWDPHISVASVSEADLPQAESLAAAVLRLPQTVAVDSLQLVDVGHENERWSVMRSWPVQT